MKAGRPKKISFPIRRVEVVHGIPQVYAVEENTTVHCVRCGQSFLINYDTAYVARDAIGSGIEEVRCPFCGRRASIYHYFDEISKKQKKQLSTSQ